MAKFLGRLVGNMLVGLIVFFVVGYFGGPKWACVGFGFTAYLIAVNGDNNRRMLDRRS